MILLIAALVVLPLVAYRIGFKDGVENERISNPKNSCIFKTQKLAKPAHKDSDFIV